MYLLQTHIDIDQPPEKVWNILVDIDNYKGWNPFVTALSGKLVPGEAVSAQLEPPGGRGFAIRPRIIEKEEGRAFAWKGKLLIPGIFDGEHHFEVHPTGDGKCRFVQWEKFTGVLVPVLKKMIEGSTRDGFRAMNQALKHRAEFIGS